MKPVYTDEMVEKAAAYRKRGWNYQQIGAAMGVNPATARHLYNRAQNQGVRAANGGSSPRAWTPDELDALARHAGEDKTAREIAALLGRPLESVRSKARTIGLSLRHARTEGGVGVPSSLPAIIAERNYAAIADKLDAGLRDPRNNVAENKRGAGAEAPVLSRLSLAVPPRGRELNVWMV
jgi:transposase